jgi:hypothetical protein
MTTSLRYGIVIGVLIWIIPLAAEEKSLNIALKIVQDGADKQPPDNITIAFDGRSIQLPVRNGVFKVPPPILITYAPLHSRQP